MRSFILTLIVACLLLPSATGAGGGPTATLSLTAGHSDPLAEPSDAPLTGAFLRFVVFDQVAIVDADALETWSAAGPVLIPPACASRFEFATVAGSPPHRISYDEAIVPDGGTARTARQHASVRFEYENRGEIVLRMGLWYQVSRLVSCVLNVSLQPLVWDLARFEMLGSLGSAIDPDSVRPSSLQPQLRERAIGLMDGDGSIRHGWTTNGLRIEGEDFDQLQSQEVSFRLTSPGPPVPLGWIIMALLSAGAAAAASTEYARFRLRTIAFALGFTRLSRDTALEHSKREELVEFVNRNPGVTFGEIRRRLGIGHGTTAYHLRVLTKQGIIQTRRDGSRCRVFPRHMPVPLPMLGTTEPFLRQAVLNVVSAEPGLTAQTIALRLNAPRRTVAHHLQRLRRRGLVHAQRRSRWLTYTRASEGGSR